MMFFDKTIAKSDAVVGAAAVELRNVSRVYNAASKPAVDSLSLSIQPGEVLALVGPSGCGKSTTLRMIAGLEPLDGGQLFLGGVDTTRTSPQERQIGWVPQNYGLFPHMSVKDNVAYGLRSRHVTKDRRDETVEKMLRLARVSEFADRPSTDLSGGQRQRVALARALATDPRVLLLDEPLAALDPQLRDELRAELATILRNTGRATVLVTHDQQEALALADRIAIMRDGKLVQCDTPAELWRRPVDSFVASFLSRGTVLQATVQNGTSVTVEGGWQVRLSDLDHDESQMMTSQQIVIRPRDVVPSTDPATGLLLRVTQCEYLGDIVRIHGGIGESGPRLIVELPSETPMGDTILVEPRPNAMTLRPLAGEEN